jgi:hypothetical protein
VDLRLWQTDTFNFLSSKAELVEAMMDPSRIFNMDETSVEVRIIYFNPTFKDKSFQIGSKGQRVYTENGIQALFSISSGSRDHITACYVVVADGSMVPPRCIFKGVRNVALTHLKDLPKDGLSGTIIFNF